MRFSVADEVFNKLNKVCFGVIVATGLNNREDHEAIARLLDASVKAAEEKFASVRAKDAREILPYREAFVTLGINPNKFMSSIEAMASRIEKRKGFPRVNPVVDLCNAISLKYLVPLGAHDLDSAGGDIQVRFSSQGDRFIPFGETEEELLEQGELIYSVGDCVKTRRWIWRQSEQGKITPASANIFIPIDGFTDHNEQAVIGARNELAALLQQLFGCAIRTGFIDKNNRQMELKQV